VPRSPINRAVNLRRSIPLLLLCAVPGVLKIRASQGDNPAPTWLVQSGPLPPLHPTAILGIYKDHPCKVIGVFGEYALIDSQGSPIRLPSSAGYRPARANAFLPGSIEVRRQSASASQLRRVFRLQGAGTIDGGVIDESGRYEATVVASQVYSGCYLAIVFFDQGFLDGQTDDLSAMVAFQKIVDLKAGAETKITADFGYIDPKSRSRTYLPLFFSHGAEIRTNFADDSARLFQRIEKLRYEKSLALYLQTNPRATAPAKPYLRFPPVFPAGVDPAAIPAELGVDFTVTSGGTVEGVLLSETVQADVLTGIQRAVQGWLFYPRLENGQPVSTAVSCKLDFGRPMPKGVAGMARQPAGK
jgi:hypothetical protein